VKTFHFDFSAAAVLAAMLFASTIALAQEPAKKSSQPAFNQSQRTDIERIVRDYLLKNPALIQEALKAQAEQERLLLSLKTKQAIQANRSALLNNPNSPVGGNPKGDVTVVEFFDYRCGYCRQVSPVVAQLIAADPKVRVVYKDFPILGPESVYGARIALAARKQNKYSDVHTALMATDTIDENAIARIAAQLGLDGKRLRSDMEDTSIGKIIDENYQLASTLNINGTPAFVVGDQMLPGATDLAGLLAFVSQERARLKSQVK